MEKEKQPKKRAYRLAKQIVHEGKWLKTGEVDFMGENGKEHKAWEMVQRVQANHINSDINGVDVVPIIKFKDGKRKLVMIANYRPPVDGYVIEFPAGLLDSENIEENAKRELFEETGYTADSIKQLGFSPILYVDPWKSNETSKIVIAYIDGDLECNQNPKQHLESDENIDVLLFDLDENLMSNIHIMVEKNNYLSEEKVYSLLIGMQLLAMAQ